MEVWLAAFVVVATAAIVIQTAILVAMYLQFRQVNQQMTRIAFDLQTKIDPILVKINRIIEDSQDRLSSIVSDGAEITRLARNQAQKVDRVFTDAVDRLRGQIIRGDHILSGALEVIEESGARFRRTLLGPVQQMSALLKGLRVGLDVIRGIRRSPEPGAGTQDEELFI